MAPSQFGCLSSLSSRRLVLILFSASQVGEGNLNCSRKSANSVNLGREKHSDIIRHEFGDIDIDNGIITSQIKQIRNENLIDRVHVRVLRDGQTIASAATGEAFHDCTRSAVEPQQDSFEE